MHPAHHARSHPDKPAVIVAETGETLTYRELDRASNRGAHLFRSMGFATGDTIALLMANGPAFLEMVWAAQRAGLYYVCLSTRLAAAEAAYILGDSGARLLVASPSLMPLAVEAARPSAVRVMAADGASSFAEARAAHPDTPIADEAPGQDMLYSSGTTGRPKGIRFAPRTGPVTRRCR